MPKPSDNEEKLSVIGEIYADRLSPFCIQLEDKSTGDLIILDVDSLPNLLTYIKSHFPGSWNRFLQQQKTQTPQPGGIAEKSRELGRVIVDPTKLRMKWKP